MATLVLDNTLYQGYATIAEQNNISVTDAMAEALRLLKQQLKKKPSLSLRQRLEKRILELRDLPVNWDYAGSPSISSEACDYSQKVVSSCSESLLQGLAIFPNTNGYILMQWKTSKGDACLSILSDRIVYDVNYGEIEKEGILPLSELSKFLEVLKNIA
jgi:hypothetical protein